MDLHSEISPPAGASGFLKDAHFVEHRPALCRFFRRRMRDATDVEDLVQEVFLRFAARRGSEVENITGYLFQTAASVLADRHRRRQVRHADYQIPFDGELHGETDFDAGRVMEGQQALKSVVAVLGELPERTQRIFVMRRLAGQSFKDIALDAGTSISAVEKQMARAVKRLRAAPALLH